MGISFADQGKTANAEFIWKNPTYHDPNFVAVGFYAATCKILMSKGRINKLPERIRGVVQTPKHFSSLKRNPNEYTIISEQVGEQ